MITSQSANDIAHDDGSLGTTSSLINNVDEAVYFFVPVVGID
jgi:hypothetical protein